MEPRRRTMLFVLRRAPYGSASGNGGVDLLLTAATFDQDVRLAFMGDGVYHLLAGQESGAAGLKNLSKVFPALELYEVKDVMVEEEALRQRNLTVEDLVLPARPVETAALAALMDQADQVFMF